MTVTAKSSGTFNRSMRLVGALLLTLSAITPASSVFVIIPGIIQQAGTGAFIAMGAAAIVAAAIAFVYAELASAFPLAGGEYAMMGHAVGPAMGFIFMGMNTVASSLAPSVLALGASTYLNVIWPWAQPVPTAIAIVATGAIFGVLNVRLNAWVTGVFLVIEMLALLVLVGLGFTHMHRSILSLMHPVVLSAGAIGPTSVALIGLATSVGVFSYNGFGQAVYFAEEMHEAPKQVARTIFWALVLTIAFEFIPMTAVLVGAPDLKRLLASNNPFGEFVTGAGGHMLGVMVSLGVAVSIVNAVIASILISARFYFSCGRDRVWNGALNNALGQLHSRFNSPWLASLLAGVISAAVCFVPLQILLVLTGTSVVVTYLLLCIAVLIGRMTGRTDHGPYRMPMFPIAPVLGLAALAYILYANWIDVSVGRPSLYATGAMLVAAAIYYGLLRRRRGPDWRLVGPVVDPALD